MNYKSILLFILINCGLWTVVCGQNPYLFHSYEDTLRKLSRIIISGEEDAVKYNANDKFINTLKQALSQEKSFAYQFDSLITVSKLYSPDKRFRLFTWTLLSYSISQLLNYSIAFSISIVKSRSFSTVEISRHSSGYLWA